jgi:AcrR family transcriptional regulator
MGSSEDEQLVATATRIFAELGFDGASIQLVADAAGVDTAGVHRRFETKADLYRAVMRRAAEAEQQAMDAFLVSFVPSHEGLIRLADAYLDFHLTHPQIMALWQHRWMGDAADVPELEELYTAPLSARMADMARGQVADDFDTDHVVWTVAWCVFGFLSGGIVYTTADRVPALRWRRGEGDEEPNSRDQVAVARFRTHMHTLLERLLTPPADGTQNTPAPRTG